MSHEFDPEMARIASESRTLTDEKTKLLRAAVERRKVMTPTPDEIRQHYDLPSPADLPNALSTIERLSAALERAEIAMTCGREDSACYCPNCDNSFYEPRDEIRAALEKDAK